jgi:hypothetical protein
MKTLDEVISYPSEVLLASDIADVIHIDAQDIREQARKNPSKLGFPVIVMGSRVKIPKDGFIHYCKYGRSIIQLDSEDE